MESVSLYNVVMVVGAVVVAFLVFREVILWYVGIGKITYLLEKQNMLISELINSINGNGEDGKEVTKDIGPSFKEYVASSFKFKKCPNCKATNRGTAQVCARCGEKL